MILPARGTVAPARDLHWPEFDRWRKTFAAWGCWPVGWEGLVVAPPAGTLEARVHAQRKRDLYDAWVERIAERAVVLARFARHGVRPRVVRQHAGSRCPACDPFDGREVSPGLDPAPPFHPGCRCVLLAGASASDRRVRRSAGRSRSG